MELIEQFDNEWVFQDPTITPAIDDEFEEALEASRRGDHRAAERIARAIASRCPNHIDAHHHLAMWIEKRGDMVTAYAFCQAAVSIGLHAIPPDFDWDRSRMEWGHLENRPFMRAYHNLALHRMRQKDWEAAIGVLSRLLAVNPNDNQGVRYELPQCWFETGDNARMDADGYIRISGRSKDIIIRGGENIPVVEVEELLYRHPGVADCAIVAMPDERLGERACAFVTLRPDADALTFEAMCGFLLERRLAKPYLPERLELIDAMPRTASGKIQKYRLRELAAGLRPMRG